MSSFKDSALLNGAQFTTGATVGALTKRTVHCQGRGAFAAQVGSAVGSAAASGAGVGGSVAAGAGLIAAKAVAVATIGAPIAIVAGIGYAIYKIFDES